MPSARYRRRLAAANARRGWHRRQRDPDTATAAAQLAAAAALNPDPHAAPPAQP